MHDLFDPGLDNGPQRLSLDLPIGAVTNARHLEQLFGSGQILFSDAVAQFDFLSIWGRSAQHGRYITGDLITCHRNHIGMAYRPTGINGNVSSPPAYIDQHYA